MIDRRQLATENLWRGKAPRAALADRVDGLSQGRLVVPLGILVPIVVLGIAGIAIATWSMGYGRRFVFSEVDGARQRWLREWPDDTVLAVHLAASGEAALIETDQGLGLVWGFGADTAAVRIGHADLMARGAAVVIRMDDFTAPSVRVRLTEQERVDWADLIARRA